MRFYLNAKYRLRLTHFVNHKLLHKVGKQWITVSLSAFVLLLGASILPVATHASEIQISNKPSITTQASYIHANLLQNANPSTIRLGSHYGENTYVRSHFRRSNRRRLLDRSGYGRVYGYTKHTFRNKYAPNDQRAYVPKNFHLVNNTVWINGTPYQIKKDPQGVNIYTYKKSNKKWLVSYGDYHSHRRIHHKRHSRKIIRKRNHKRNLIKRYSHRHIAKKLIRKRYRRSVHHQPRKTVSHTYLLSNVNTGSPVFSNHGFNDLKNNDVTNYSDDYSDITESDNPAVKVTDQDNLYGYNFDKIYGNNYGTPISGWVFSDELSHSHKRHYKSNDISSFKTAMSDSLAQKYFTSDERNQINNFKDQYHYLQKNEDQSNSDSNEATSSFRQHEIDWINFYRSMFGESPVSEDFSFDRKAQDGADNQQDPEDMNWGDTDPEGAVESYFTDANNADDNGTAGHRDSLLNPQAESVGVGQHNDVNALYFDWGINDGASVNYLTNIAYPAPSVFPLSDAQNAQYWSYQFNNDPYGSDSQIPTPDIEVHDDTSNNDVSVSHITTTNREVYYAVDTNALKPYHQYTITISGDGIPNGSYSYITKLYNL